MLDTSPISSEHWAEYRFVGAAVKRVPTGSDCPQRLQPNGVDRKSGLGVQSRLEAFCSCIRQWLNTKIARSMALANTGILDSSRHRGRRCFTSWQDSFSEIRSGSFAVYINRAEPWVL